MQSTSGEMVWSLGGWVPGMEITDSVVLYYYVYSAGPLLLWTRSLLHKGPVLPPPPVPRRIAFKSARSRRLYYKSMHDIGQADYRMTSSYQNVFSCRRVNPAARGPQPKITTPLGGLCLRPVPSLGGLFTPSHSKGCTSTHVDNPTRWICFNPVLDLPRSWVQETAAAKISGHEKQLYQLLFAAKSPGLALYRSFLTDNNRQWRRPGCYQFTGFPKFHESRHRCSARVLCIYPFTLPRHS